MQMCIRDSHIAVACSVRTDLFRVGHPFVPELVEVTVPVDEGGKAELFPSVMVFYQREVVIDGGNDRAVGIAGGFFYFSRCV